MRRHQTYFLDRIERFSEKYFFGVWIFTRIFLTRDCWIGSGSPTSVLCYPHTLIHGYHARSRTLNHSSPPPPSPPPAQILGVSQETAQAGPNLLMKQLSWTIYFIWSRVWQKQLERPDTMNHLGNKFNLIEGRFLHFRATCSTRSKRLSDSLSQMEIFTAQLFSLLLPSEVCTVKL